MSHDLSEQNYHDMAALYALGILAEEEKLCFEDHLRTGCHACQSEVSGFENVSRELAYSVPTVYPPPKLRNRLLEEILSPRAASREPEIVVKRSQTMDWEATSRAGILVKHLRVDSAGRFSSRLVCMLPGATLPRHRHLEMEEFLILEGHGELLGQSLGPGDYHRAPAGSVHGASRSNEGCIYICFSAPKYQLLEDQTVPTEPDQFVTIPSHSSSWLKLREEFEVIPLYGTADRPYATALVKLRPASRKVAVDMFKAEEIFVIEGEAYLDSRRLSTGDSAHCQTGYLKANSQTQGGCLLLVHSFHSVK